MFYVGLYKGKIIQKLWIQQHVERQQTFLLKRLT